MNWNNITIGKFRKLQKIIKSEEDELTKKIYIYCELTGYRIEDVREMPLSDFLKQYSKELSFMNDGIPQIINQAWEYEGISYKITTDITQMTAGQYIDFKEFSKEPDNIHNLMAVLCYPEKSYDGVTHEKRAALFNDKMPITISYPLCVFFLELWKEWSEISLAYSEKVLKKATKEWQDMGGSIG